MSLCLIHVDRVLFLVHVDRVLFLIHVDRVLFLIHVDRVLFLIHVDRVLFLIHVDRVLFLIHVDRVLFLTSYFFATSLLLIPRSMSIRAFTFSLNVFVVYFCFNIANLHKRLHNKTNGCKWGGGES